MTTFKLLSLNIRMLLVLISVVISNNIGDDQTARTRGLICAFVARMQQSQVFHL